VALTKTKAAKEDPGENRIQNKKLDKYYAGISLNRDAMVVKLLDRVNNVSCMASGFTRERMADYIKETEVYILPMMDKLQHSCPEFYDAVFLLRYQLLSLLETIKRLLV